MPSLPRPEVGQHGSRHLHDARALNGEARPDSAINPLLEQPVLPGGSLVFPIMGAAQRENPSDGPGTPPPLQLQASRPPVNGATRPLSVRLQECQVIENTRLMQELHAARSSGSGFVSQENDLRSTAICLACRDGHVSWLSNLLGHMEAEDSLVATPIDGDLMTPLEHACRLNHSAVVDVLFHSGHRWIDSEAIQRSILLCVSWRNLGALRTLLRGAAPDRTPVGCIICALRESGQNLEAIEELRAYCRTLDQKRWRMECQEAVTRQDVQFISLVLEHAKGCISEVSAPSSMSFSPLAAPQFDV